MTPLYLYVNAGLYLIFAVWMTLSPWKTAAAVGYDSLAANGRSEFLVIYGGLQLGLAIFFAFIAMNSTYHRIGLVFSLCLYAPIVIYRIITVIRFHAMQGSTLAIGALEIGLLCAATLLYFRNNASSS